MARNGPSMLPALAAAAEVANVGSHVAREIAAPVSNVSNVSAVDAAYADTVAAAPDERRQTRAPALCEPIGR